MRTESEFLIDVLGRLNRVGIDAMLAGSMASNYWGIPRSTHDLDFVLVLRPSQVQQLVNAFESVSGPKFLKGLSAFDSVMSCEFKPNFWRGCHGRAMAFLCAAEPNQGLEDGPHATR